MKDLISIIGRMSLTLALALVIGNSAHAYVFTLDNFAINKNGSTFFEDGFNGSVAPPEGPNGPNTYSVQGAVGPEANGRLTLDRNDAASFTTALGETTLFQGARLRTNIDGSNPDNGFYLGDAVSLATIFDLIPPAEQRQSYGVRFTDRAAGLGFPGNDLTEIRVIRTRTDQLRISFVDISFVDATVSFISSALLDITHDQIALMLDQGTTGLVTASYAYLDGGMMGGVTSLAGNAQIFEGEDWTRAQLFARQVLPVPEPTTLALMGLGLAGIGFRRKRKLA